LTPLTAEKAVKKWIRGIPRTIHQAASKKRGSKSGGLFNLTQFDMPKVNSEKVARRLEEII